MRKISILFACLIMSVTSFAQNWLLLGNAGTNPPTNFVGTTDNEPLVFKTDATEYMRILTNGKVGIGTTSPQLLFHVYSATAGSQAAITGTAPALYFGPGTTFTGGSNGGFGFSTGTNDFVGGSVAGDFIISNNDTAHSLIFSVNQTAGNGIERMRINRFGYVGIAQASPTAKFDVNCSTVSGQTNPSNIRFENLQRGGGTLLVIDSNGYVYRDTGSTQGGAMANTPLVTDMQSQIEDLRNQVQELRSLLASRLALTTNELKQLNNESASWLGNVYPNPANNSTTIEYSLPSGVGAAFCQVYSLSGAQVAGISLPAAQGKSQVQLNTSKLAAGMYIYALVADGKVLGTKQLAVVR
jgi:hypothetical protein